MLLLSWIRSSRTSQAFASFNLLASKRCFSGGADTSRRPLRPCGTHRALPDGDRRKKRGIDFTTQKHSGILPAWSKVSENQALNRGVRRHPAPPTLKMRFKSLAAARNTVRIHPEIRPATSPRAPAAATPFFPSHSHATSVFRSYISSFLWSRTSRGRLFLRLSSPRLRASAYQFSGRLVSSIPPTSGSGWQSKPAVSLPQPARSPSAPKKYRDRRPECALSCGTPWQPIHL